MLIALLALIGFQWYWIENAIAVKREQFDRKVIEALNQTVNQIEKQEVIFLARQKIKEQENKRLEEIAYIKTKSRQQTPAKKPGAALKSSDKPEWTDINKTKPNEDILANKGNRKANSIPSFADSLLAFEPNTPLPGFEVEFTNPTDMFRSRQILLPENELEFIRDILRDQSFFWNQINTNSQRVLIQEQNIKDVVRAVNGEIDKLKKRRRSGKNPDFRTFQTSESFYYEFSPEKSYNLNTLPELSPLTSKKANGDSLMIIATKKPFDKPSLIKPEGKINPVGNKTAGLITEQDKTHFADNVFEKTQNKANLVKDVFTDFLQGNRNIYERLNQQMLDTLLHQELENRGIDIPYEYGVKNDGNMIFTSYALNYDPTLTQKSYNVKLFPNDAISQNQFLYVYFPQKEDFILGNMWSVFGSSLLLILMIGGIFYASVNTMLQQKRLSIIKNDFINNMTHEFKTPISTISLAVEVLKDEEIERNKEKTDRYLNIIRDENGRLGSQVEKVLQIALLDKGEVKLNKSSVDLNDIVEQVYHNLGVQIESRGGTVELDLQAENGVFEADEVHLTNIVYNLLDNANKYSPETPEIKIKTENTAKGIKLIVSDKGIGMTKEQINKIFDKFYRVSTGNLHDVKGFGLGLSYVKKMVELHQGTIEVNSKPKEGTTFEIKFDYKSQA